MDLLSLAALALAWAGSVQGPLPSLAPGPTDGAPAQASRPTEAAVTNGAGDQNAPVLLTGDPQWIGPLWPLLSDRIPVPVLAGTEPKPAGSWSIDIAPCVTDGCLQLRITDPVGAAASERFAVDAGAARELTLRSLAAYVASIIRREAEVPWTPAQGEPPPRDIAERQPAVLEVAVVGVELCDLGRPSTASVGGEVQARLLPSTAFWVGARVGVEPRHVVAESPRRVERWGVPVTGVLGSRLVVGAIELNTAVGVAGRVLHLEPADFIGIERFAVGGMLAADARYAMGSFSVGLTGAVTVWSRRMQLRDHGEIFYRDGRTQASVGILAGYRI